MKHINVATEDGTQIIFNYFDTEVPEIGDILVVMEQDGSEPEHRLVVGVLRGVLPGNACNFVTVLTQSNDVDVSFDFSLN